MADGGAQVELIEYSGEHQLPLIRSLIDLDLSEPYSIFTYRYFVNQWPHLTLLAMHENSCVGTIVCKLDNHTKRGYIAMLAVSKSFRRKGLGSTLVKAAIRKMQNENAHEIVLEAEFCNSAAIELYTNLGFIKTKLLSRYYLNGSDAYRLKLALKPPNPPDDLYNPKREQKSSTGGNLSDSE